jgi:putative transposase
MPRRSRIDAAGALHHGIVRGIERTRIFQDQHDRNDFLARLSTIIKETDTQCCAWELIPNRLHLLLKAGLAPLSKVMPRLLTEYASTTRHRPRCPAKLYVVYSEVAFSLQKECFREMKNIEKEVV